MCIIMYKKVYIGRWIGMLWASLKISLVYTVYVMHPLGICPLGFSKRPIGSKIAVLASRENSEFGITANAFFDLIGSLGT